MTYPFSGGPFNGQSLIVDMIETTRGPVLPEEVRLDVIETKFGPVAKFSPEGSEVYRLIEGEYVWQGA
jgi:hypothetical protein